MKTRRSCRAFLPGPVEENVIEQVIDAALQAPSPLNSQPWSFVVVTSPEMQQTIRDEAARYKQELIEKSGWKWLEKYSLDYVGTVPVMIAVFGNPLKSGADSLMEESGGAWRDACGAAIQNAMLMAESLGFATLWFTMYNKENLARLLGVDPPRVPLALLFLGKADGPVSVQPRKSVTDVTRYIR
jgi:nitroreductase